MTTTLFNPKNANDILLLVILGAFILFFFVIPLLNDMCKGEIQNMTENLENVSGTHKIDLNKCSPQCCKFTQWKLPKELEPKGPLTEAELENVIGSNFSCGNGDGSSCVCFTTDDFNYLKAHGGNKCGAA